MNIVESQPLLSVFNAETQVCQKSNINDRSSQLPTSIYSTAVST